LIISLFLHNLNRRR